MIKERNIKHRRKRIFWYWKISGVLLQAGIPSEYATDKIPGIPFARNKLDETSNKIDLQYQDSSVWFYLACQTSSSELKFILHFYFRHYTWTCYLKFY